MSSSPSSLSVEKVASSAFSAGGSVVSAGVGILPLLAPAIAVGSSIYAAKSSQGGKTHHGGPGSHVYWKGQLQRLQAVMQNPAAPRAVQQAARELAARYKASDAGDAIKGAYPVIPEEQIAAIEGAAAAGKSFATDPGSRTWLIVGGVALVLIIAGGALYASRRKKRR